MLLIREAESKDLDQVYQLEKNLFKDFCWTPSQILKEYENEFSKIWLLEEKNEIIGYLILREVKPEVEILRIGIKKEFQHKGKGSYFLKELIDFYKKKGIKKIFLEVKISNSPAYNFYKKMGFKEIYKRKKYYDKEDGIVMVKEINNEGIYYDKSRD